MSADFFREPQAVNRIFGLEERWKRQKVGKTQFAPMCFIEYNPQSPLFLISLGASQD